MDVLTKKELFFSFGYEKYEASDPIQMQAFQSGLVSKEEADAVIMAAKDVIGYDAGSYNKGLEEEDGEAQDEEPAHASRVSPIPSVPY